MAGQLTIDTLKASTGVLATQNGMTGIAKAWVQFNGTAGTLTNSFNVSSITKTSAGLYTVNLTTAMPNANYAVVGGVGSTTATGVWFTTGNTIGGFTVNNTTTSFRIAIYYQTNNVADAESIGAAILSN